MKKRILATFLVLSVLFTMSFASPPAYASSEVPVGIPIRSASDFMKIEQNPSGDYYLTQDIELPENTILFSDENTFTGTLDGNGFAIKNYTINDKVRGRIKVIDHYATISLFGSTNNVTIKNLKMTNINIDCSIPADVSDYIIIAPLVANDGHFWGRESLLENIYISGKVNINLEKNTKHCTVYGIASCCGTMKECTSNTNIVINGTCEEGYVAGIGTASDEMISCKNNGALNISLLASPCEFGDNITVVGVGYANSLRECINSGKITVVENAENPKTHVSFLRVSGVSSISETSRMETIEKCGNIGDISVKADAVNLTMIGGVGGLSSQPSTLCYNKGRISADIKGYLPAELLVGGISAGRTSAEYSQCYNTGNLTIKADKKILKSYVGGIHGGDATAANNCYNTGNITIKGLFKDCCYVGGISSNMVLYDHYSNGEEVKPTANWNYNTGKISSPKKSVTGSIFAGYSGPSRRIGAKKNYHTTKTKAYGNGDLSGKYKPQAKKVSAINKNTCKGFSSKIWKYSKAKKRMVLKKNPE